MRSSKRILLAAALPATLLLGACGGDDGYDDNRVGGCGLCNVEPVAFQITLTGLAANGTVVLGDSTGTTTTLSANGSTNYVAYTAYPNQALVGVLVQPSGQNCSVSNGVLSANSTVAVSVACSALPTPAPAALVLYAGGLATGYADATGTAAGFNGPSALAADAAGNLYVADTVNATIRKIAPGGVVTTLAGATGVFGSSDGTGAAASFRGPNGVATDSAGNVYVADTYNNTIRKITPGGVVSTLAGTAGISGSADGTGAAASFLLPVGVVVDASGNVYVADFGNDTIRRITPAGVVTTIAGAAGSTGSTDGTGAAARFNGPQGLALDNAGNLLVADSWNDTIRRVTPAGAVTTVAGLAGVVGAANGALNAATFSSPLDVAVDSAGDLYVVDNGNSAIRKISASTSMVSTVVGTAGQGVFSAGTLPGSLQNPTSAVLVGSTLYLTTINGVAQVVGVP